MTPDDLHAEFERRFGADQATMRGADSLAIIKAIAAEYDVPVGDVREAVIAGTIAGPC